jgi:hypothetical protein
MRAHGAGSASLRATRPAVAREWSGEAIGSPSAALLARSAFHFLAASTVLE